MPLTDTITWRGRSVDLVWEPDFPLGAPHTVTQVSGVCFTTSNHVLLVSEDGANWTLPGGHPEPGEGAEETLRREVCEEACATIQHCHYLGAQRVEDPSLPEPTYQLRYWALVKVHPFMLQHQIHSRGLFSIGEAQQRLYGGQSPIAEALLRAALEIATI